MSIIDIDTLLPENDVISFTAKDGKRYDVEMFIPAAVGFTIIDNLDKLAGVFPKSGGKPTVSRDTIDLALKILADICGTQFPHMTREWIGNNISLPRQALIIFKMANPVLEFLQSQGFMEAVRPAKEPAEK